jgi:hypothetical protein
MFIYRFEIPGKDEFVCQYKFISPHPLNRKIKEEKKGKSVH